MSKIIQVELEKPKKCSDCNYTYDVLYGLSNQHPEEYLCANCFVVELIRKKREIK